MQILKLKVKNNNFNFWLILIFSIMIISNKSFGDTQQGKLIFEKNCVSCHTIGQGKKVGPDLKNIETRAKKDWIINFITAPDKMIASGDAQATSLLKEFNNVQMPNLGISAPAAESILMYIKESSTSPSTSTQEQVNPVFEKGNADNGLKLFTGEISFKNGGAPCISCHNIANVGILGGGAVAKDLTNAYSRLGGASGISAILQGLPFPAMKAIFSVKPLTDSEIADLIVYFKQTNNLKANNNGATLFFLIGFVGTLIFIILLQIFWGKKYKSVNKKLLAGTYK